MWESLLSHPRGRVSSRKYITIATAFLVVCFAYIFIAAPTAMAADAEWNNGAIVYEGDTYKKIADSKGTESHKLSKDTIIYEFRETMNGGNGGPLQKAHLIYFPSGTDPTTATSAPLRTYSVTEFDAYIGPSDEKTITLTPSAQDPGVAAGTPESDNPGTSSCDSTFLNGIGWIVCPATNYLAKGMDLVYSWVDGFLEVRPLATTQDQALYRAWSYMRTFANIAFIIAFLIIIYSQISNVGLSNYDIKKMLPRIVVAAILVNTSYWICAIAVDIFNILGYSVQDLFIMIRNSLVGTEGNSWDSVSWESFAALVLSGGSIAGGAGIAAYLGITSGTLVVAGAGVVGGLVVLLLPALLSLLFVILMTFLILAARQAIITILIVIAPLAFVAFLLPNTEKWFEKWRSTLFTLLLLFPAFSLVFGGAQLASAIIIQNATSLNVVLLGMAVQIAPLLITPLLLKLGGGVLNRFAGLVNNPTKGVFDRGKNWARERTEQNKAAGLANLDKRAQDRGFVNGKPTDGNWRRRTRLNPNNMAYLREYNRRKRTGMKTANEGVSEGYFADTAAGRQIYNREQEGSMRKHAAEESNSRNLQRSLYNANFVQTDPDNQQLLELRGLHHRAAVDKGFSAEYTAAMDNHANLDLQTQIARNVDNIGNIKVHADVDAGLAEQKKKLVASQGQLALKQTIEGDRALSYEVEATTRLDKQAAEYDTIVQKAAEAAYDNYSRTNVNAQELRLRAVAATERATHADEKWKVVVDNAKAQGYSANLVFDQNSLIAEDLQALQQDIQIETQAQNSEKLVQQSNLANALKADVQLRRRAAGSDPHGEVRVLAAAKKAVSDELIKATNNVYDTMDYDLASDPDALEIAWNDAANRGEMSEVIAYARKLSLNAPGLRKLKPLLEQFTVGKDPLADDVMLLKEVLAGDDGFRNAGRDMEVWANNEKNPDTGQIYADFAEARNASGPYANITASRFARMNAYSQEETLYWLQQNDAANGTDKLDQLLDGIGDHNSQVWRELKGSTREQITAYRSGGQIRNPN